MAQDERNPWELTPEERKEEEEEFLNLLRQGIEKGLVKVNPRPSESPAKPAPSKPVSRFVN